MLCSFCSMQGFFSFLCCIMANEPKQGESTLVTMQVVLRGIWPSLKEVEFSDLKAR